ncbi:hypothetical protein ACHAXA_009351 [Cyclostephanos tholiformis]|uniref:Uncharacterized protein n=1 Tax=Cyclostephanos tholiformis TaxID=382380 RepID=A0ABD3SQ81_9STRA
MAMHTINPRLMRCRPPFLFAAFNLLVLITVRSPSGRIVLPLVESTRISIPSEASSRALFGVRGGAFFGFGRSSSKSRGGGGGGGDGGEGGGAPPRRFPPLSQDEIEEKLNVPVFGLTDAHGNGVILSDGDRNSVFHFFFSRHMADAALRALCDANVGVPPLRVSAFHLGKCWFRLINGGSREYRLKKYGGVVDGDDEDSTYGDEVTRRVLFRLVPNAKDLMGARILTGLRPGDVERLRDAMEEPNPPKALSIIQGAANNGSSSFSSPFDQIPVFTIAQMRVRKKDDRGNSVGDNMMPFHFSTKTMSETWTEFVSQSPQFQDAEATLQLIELHTMIEMMQSESDFDFRNVVFIYPQYDNDSQGNDKDDSDDDENDDGGGGGDNGMKTDESSFVIEPFVSMEIFAEPGKIVQL